MLKVCVFNSDFGGKKSEFGGTKEWLSALNFVAGSALYGNRSKKVLLQVEGRRRLAAGTSVCEQRVVHDQQYGA